MKPISLEPCLPPFWSRNGHSQTILGHLLPSPRLDRDGRKVIIDLSDGDKLTGDLIENKSDVLIYLFHGLGGDITADYMERTARLAIARGHSVFLINFRGCGAGEVLARQSYHSGRGEDFSEVISLGRRWFPRKRHLAIGFSLGGNALLNLITGKRGDTLPDYAICVNAPIDMAACADRLGHGLNQIYEHRFMQLLVGNLERRHRCGAIDKRYRFSRFARIKDFDAIYTAPAGGFRDCEDYYEQTSTHRHLDKITIPTFLLTSKDDPFIPFGAYANAKLSSSVQLHIESVGGHLGYISRRKNRFGTLRWLDYALDEIIQSMI